MYKSKFCMIINVQKMYKLYKTCTKFKLKVTWNLKHVFCTYKQCTNNTKPIQLANWNSLWNSQCTNYTYKMYTNVNWIMYATANVCFLYIQKPYILYFSNFHINNNTIFRSILQLCKISRPIFPYSKRYTDKFIL